MSRHARLRRRVGFTLIELMVVVSIIGLLVAVLLPAFGTVRTKAAIARTKTQFVAIDAGLELFRAEGQLGGAYPPSSSDNPADRQLITDPKDPSKPARIAGAHLLVHALVGADGLGPPGFRDTDRDGQWWNDTRNDVGGIYELDPTTGKEKFPRYGGAGFVDEKMRASIKSLQVLMDEGDIVNVPEPTDVALNEPMFLDSWDRPILYYKANSSSLKMVTSDTGRGTYTQEDNGIITGTTMGATPYTGIDFGPGKTDDLYHAMAVAESPLGTDSIDDMILMPGTKFDNSFARFILDAAVKARPTAVLKSKYLLISAGPDGRFGTVDDVTNWERRID